MELFKSFDFAFTVFNAFQLVSFCLVSFSSVYWFHFVNKWIHSFVEQLDQGEAAAKINSFYVRSPVNQTGGRYRTAELAGDQNPSPEAPPRSKREGSKGDVKGEAMEKNRYVGVIEGKV